MRYSSGFAEEDSGKQNPPSQLIRVLETNRSIETHVRIRQSYFLFRIMNLQNFSLFSDQETLGESASDT